MAICHTSVAQNISFNNVKDFKALLSNAFAKSLVLGVRLGTGLYLHSTLSLPVDTGRKLNVHKTFRRRPGRLLNVLYLFNLRPVSTRNKTMKIRISSGIYKTIYHSANYSLLFGQRK